MSGICGWLNREHNASASLIETLARNLAGNGAEPVQTQTAAHAAVAGRCHDDTLHTYREDSLLAAVLGHARLDGTAPSQVAAELARRYRAQGPAVLRDLHGHFALALVDESRQEALLAIDRMGVESLSYHASAGLLVFASNANAIRAHPQVRGGIDPQALFDYLYFHVVPGPGTVFRGIRRLPPAHYLHFRDGRAELHNYWRPDFDVISRAGYDELREAFRNHLTASVATAMEGARCGTFLSGGTDSSTVTGYAQLLGEEPVPSFSIGFAAEGYDEMDFARTAARHFGVRHHEYYITPDDIVAAVPLIAASYEQPFGNSSAVPTYFCARLAREHGMTRLLAGDGGDELFGGNERYARQFVFALYDAIPRPLRNGLVQPLIGRIGSTNPIAPLRKLRRYVDQASVAMPMRMETYNLLHHLGVAAVLEPDFLAGIDTGEPQRLLEERYRDVPARHLVNRMLALDFQFTLADNDLPKVTRMCDAAGIDVAFPLLDDALVAFSLQLPPRYKLAGTRLRPFFKRALDDFLPQKTIKKSKHGFGLPFGVWLRSHAALRDLVAGALASLKHRGIVRADFIDELIRQQAREHAGYYGNMVWILVMLEYWFRHQVDLAADKDTPSLGVKTSTIHSEASPRC